jgi:DNA-binding XRE family transcriptional regulator
MSDTVTIPRAEYEALLTRADEADDPERVAALAARIAAAHAAGEDPHAGNFTAEMVERLIEGDHPLAIWRAHRGLTIAALAALAGVPGGYISEIENRKKPGSIAAYAKLAKALDTTIDALVDEPGTD